MLLALALACLDYDVNNPADEDPALEDDTGSLDTADTGEVVIPGTTAFGKVYANTSVGLFEVDPATSQPSFVGNFHTPDGTEVDGFIDIAIDLTGRIYGGTFDALYRVDAKTAEVELVCTTPVAMFALAFSSDGRLFAGGREGIDLLNLENCSSEPLIGDDIYVTSGDVVGLPDGNLYWTVFGDDGDDLVLLDPDSGATKRLGSIGVGKLFGLGYDDETLYGFSSNGEIVEIDPENGSGRITGTSDSNEWWGATTNPVRW